MDLRRLFSRRGEASPVLVRFAGERVHETLVEVSPNAGSLQSALPDGLRAARDPTGRGLLFVTRRHYPELVLNGEAVGAAQVVDLATLVEPTAGRGPLPYAQLWWATDHEGLYEALAAAGLHATLVEGLAGEGAQDTIVGEAQFSFHVPPPGGVRAEGNATMRQVQGERTYRAVHDWDGRRRTLTRTFTFEREGKGEGRLVVDEDAHLAILLGAGKHPGTAKVFRYDGEDVLRGPNDAA